VNSFIIYPLVVYFTSKNYSGRITIHGFEPTISILIAAYNEEKVVEERIRNISELNYNLNKVEVFIGSDLSSDKTNEILLENQKKFPWLKIYLSNERKGKAGILNELIKQVNHEILVFTDANTEFQKDSLKNLIEDFADDKVGGVCGRLVLLEDEQSKSEGVEESEYWKYETLIKKSEGRSGILLAANGGIFAIRKNLYEVIPTKHAVTDDLFVSLSVVSKGFKFTYCNEAVAYENTGKDLTEEYKRKVRFSATNFQTLVQFKKLLWDKNKFLSYAFFSHKVSRWILPGLLILLFIVSYFLIDINLIARKVFYLQMVIYLLALCGYLLSIIRKRILIFSLPYFFVISNIAIAEGFIKFIRKKHSVIWESTQR
jgi:cellulose synthase/poly-beta-1,6-N-acetylglucosamine synthase-like glycosyltransferase